MSEAISEMVAREAEEAEREDEGAEEEPDGGSEEEPDAEPEAPAAPEDVPEARQPSEREMERAFKAIERAGDRYTKSILQIQKGVDLGLVECPLCPVPGFVALEAPPEGFDPLQVEAIRNYLGIGPQRHYRQAPHLTRCTDCDGEGFWSTDSQREGYMDVQCDVCMGSGFVDARHAQAMADAAPLTPPAGSPPYLTVAPDQPTGLHASQVVQGGHSFQLIPGGAPDQHGRLPGHPLWGAPIEQGGI